MNKRVVAPPANFQLASLSSDEITNLGHVADPGQMQAPAPVDPLFSSSGKLISDLSVELSGGRSATVEQFAQLIPQKGVQSGTSDTDKFIPSGANFRDASVDLLPHGPAPLPLLGPERHATSLSDATHASLNHNLIALAVTPVPTVTIPAPGGPATQVFEAGLLARPGEPAGS